MTASHLTKTNVVAALAYLVVLGCGGRAEAHDESPQTNVEVPVYLMRPARPTGEPTLFVAGRWVATGGALAEQPMSGATCLAGSRAGSVGWLFLELADSVDLSELGVTGVYFNAVVGGTNSSSVTFGVLEVDGSTHCVSRQWGDADVAFSQIVDECAPDDGTPDPALIHSLSWSANATPGIVADFSFCVDVRLIDDSYLL